MYLEARDHFGYLLLRSNRSFKTKGQACSESLNMFSNLTFSNGEVIFSTLMKCLISLERVISSSSMR